MLAANYRGEGTFQRSNTNTHIFSKLLQCEKCGSTLNASLDSPRKDGYRPSRYICYTTQQYHSVDSHRCNNFISDITLLPFIINYISNLINLQKRITNKHSLRDIERILLRGHAFIDVLGIDKKGLEDTYLSFAVGFKSAIYENSYEEDDLNMELTQLTKEKNKYEKALSRLEDLYLFSEEAMSEKSFLFKKRDIVSNIERLNSDISNYHKKMADKQLSVDTTFLNKASNFLMHQEISNKRDIDFKELLDVVDKSIIKDFINTVVEHIVVNDKKVISITFKNGITHKFVYRPIENQKIHSKSKYLYRSFESQILDYLSEYGSINRVEVEQLTGLTRTSALSLIHEFMDQDLIEKRGNSIAIRYYLKKEKIT